MSAISNQEQFFLNIADAELGTNIITSKAEVTSTSCPWGRIVKKLRLDYAPVSNVMKRGYDLEEAAKVIKEKATAFTTVEESATEEEKLRIITSVNSAIFNFNDFVDHVNAKRPEGKKIEKLNAVETVIVAAKPAKTDEPAPAVEQDANSPARKKRLTADERARKEAAAFTGINQ